MNTAHIKQHSAIWNLWRAHHRVGGIIYGAHFAWEPGNIYRTGPLSPEQVVLLRMHDCVEVEGTAEATPRRHAAAPQQVVAVKSSAALRKPPGPPGEPAPAPAAVG